jgi:hypothetical protein
MSVFGLMSSFGGKREGIMGWNMILYIYFIVCENSEILYIAFKP